MVASTARKRRLSHAADTSTQHSRSNNTCTRTAVTDIAECLSSTPDAVKNLVERFALSRNASQLPASQSPDVARRSHYAPTLTLDSASSTPHKEVADSTYAQFVEYTPSQSSLSPTHVGDNIHFPSTIPSIKEQTSAAFPEGSRPLYASAYANHESSAAPLTRSTLPLYSSTSTAESTSTPISEALLNISKHITHQREQASSGELPTLLSEKLLKLLLYMKLASYSGDVNVSDSSLLPTSATASDSESTHLPATQLPNHFLASAGSSPLPNNCIRPHAHTHDVGEGSSSSAQYCPTSLSSSFNASFGEGGDTLFPVDVPFAESLTSESLFEVSDSTMTDEVITCINELCLGDHRSIDERLEESAVACENQAIIHEIDSLNALTLDLISRLPDASQQ